MSAPDSTASPPVSGLAGATKSGFVVSARVVILAVVVLLAWAGLVVKLATDWSTNAQYEFGYFVPFFIGYLMARRWADRPVPSRRLARKPLAYGFFGLVALLPIRLIQEANPDWRPLNWIHAGVVIAITGAAIAAVGGRAWIWHFLAPTMLIFFALPWPLGVEQAMVQDLTGAVTRVTVELLNLANIPALQRGNVIEVATGPVGVADACSGMRSLAGTLMASAFFGEFFRFTRIRRVVLILCGVVVAFGLNLCRTFFLSSRAAAEGIASISVWHDRAGYTIFLISFALLWLLARVLSAPLPPIREDSPPMPVPRVSAFVTVTVALWIVAVYAFSEGWYRYHERAHAQSASWSVHWPEKSETFKMMEVPEEVRSILRYTEGYSGSFDWPDGPGWQVFLLRWAPGRSSAQLATMHRPDICMPAAGFKFLSNMGDFEVVIDGVKFPFQGSVFDSSGLPVYVFRCLWEEQPLTGLAENRNFDMSVTGRVLSAWYGKRNLGQKLLQIAISGVHSEEDARNDLERRLSGLISVRDVARFRLRPAKLDRVGPSVPEARKATE